MNEYKIIIYKTNSKILEFESSQKCMSDKHNQVHTSSNTNNEHIHRIQGELKSLVQDNAYLQSDSSQFNWYYKPEMSLHAWHSFHGGSEDMQHPPTQYSGKLAKLS